MSDKNKNTLRRSKNRNTAGNYHQAADINVSLPRSWATKAVDWINNQFGCDISTGLSNCTLTATQWVNPKLPLARAQSIIDKGYGYTKIPEHYAVPGDLVIATNPLNNAHHTMLLSGFVKQPMTHKFMEKDYNLPQGHPLVRYSNGSTDSSGYRRSVGLMEYIDNSEGKTDVQYYRYITPGSMEVLIPEITVTPEGATSKGSSTLISRPPLDYKKAKRLSEKFKTGGVVKFYPGGPFDAFMQKIRSKAKKSSVKPDPNLDETLQETWVNENPNNVGLQSDGSWKPYYDKNRAQWLIGPGFDYKQNGYSEFKNGATTEQINDAVKEYHQHSLDLINNVYLPKFTNRPDTISPQIKNGLLDLRYQTGNLVKWTKLGKAISEGDIELIQKEGQVKDHSRRNNLRNKNNWNYK